MRIKVSNYRPNRIIERDPNESTYAVGDDKFTTLATCEDLDLAKYIVRCVNSHNQLVAIAGIAKRVLNYANRVSPPVFFERELLDCVNDLQKAFDENC